MQSVTVVALKFQNRSFKKPNEPLEVLFCQEFIHICEQLGSVEASSFKLFFLAHISNYCEGRKKKLLIHAFSVSV